MLLPKIEFAKDERFLKKDFRNFIQELQNFLDECTDEIQFNKISCLLKEMKEKYKSYFGEIDKED